MLCDQSQFSTPIKQGHWSIIQDPHAQARATRTTILSTRETGCANRLCLARTVRRIGIPVRTNSIAPNHNSPNKGKGKSSLPKARNSCLLINSIMINGSTMRSPNRADDLMFASMVCIGLPSAESNKRSLRIPMAVSMSTTIGLRKRPP